MSSVRHTLVAGSIGALLAAGVVLLVPRHTREPDVRRLSEPAYLPESAKQQIRSHMYHHGADLTELEWDVLLLDYDATRARAERVAREPTLLPPLDDKALLPQRFYRLQDEMQAAALRMANAAGARDPELLAQAYGQLAVTCVACHRVYLAGPPPR